MKRCLPIVLFLLAACTRHLSAPDSLHDAVKRNDCTAVQQLIAAGAPVNARDNDGLTPLMLACMNLQEENIRILVQAGADPQARNAAGTTAWQMLMRGDSIPSRAPACRRALQEAMNQQAD